MKRWPFGWSVVTALVLCGCAGQPQPTLSPPTGSAASATQALAAPSRAPAPTPALATTGYPPPASGQSTAYPAPKQPPAEGAWAADGVISAKEYSDTATVGSFTLRWRNDITFLYLAAEAPTKGWVAVGLDPVDRMMGANYLQGWYDGQAHLQDQYGTAPTGASHAEDTALGGTNDIVAYAVVEDGDLTRWEAQIPLDSGDSKDKPLKPGGIYTVIVAMGVSDAPSSPHAFQGATRIALSRAP